MFTLNIVIFVSKNLVADFASSHALFACVPVNYA